MSGLMPIPALPENAPFTPRQRAWINGFLAGYFNEARESQATRSPLQPSTQPKPIHLLFGSQSGTAEQLAKRVAKAASQHGFDANIKPLNDLPVISGPAPIIIITSTWGDGDPPDNAATGLAWLQSPDSRKLQDWPYAVLALGDRNYTDFCGAGRKFDDGLASIGARRLLPRVDCDIDYESSFQAWFSSVWSVLKENSVVVPSNPSARIEPASPTPTSKESSTSAEGIPSPVEILSSPDSAKRATRLSPAPALFVEARRLNHSRSTKDTRHVVLSSIQEPLAYEAGDALGVVPSNCPVLVEELLASLGFQGDEPVSLPTGKNMPLHQALLREFVITQPTSSLVHAAIERSSSTELQSLIDPSRKLDLDQWMSGRDMVDVLKACAGAQFQPSEFVSLLRKLQPRLYSISSSPKANPGQVHLTVATVRYETHGRAKKGVASCWLADRLIPGESNLPVFLQPSKHFRLPSDGRAPIIMVGPGTGIAPFRAFLQERKVTGAQGPNWLFFGDQRRTDDFLYEEEIVAMVSDGHLTRLDLAFSRDQEAKIYVQDRMQEQASELWAWLEAGAHFYVCGDARRMAKDVDQTLHQIIESAGGKSPDQAAEYVAALKAAHRYERDVY